MTELHFPWLELSVLVSVVGAVGVSCLRDPDTARKACLWFSGAALACTVAVWRDFSLLHVEEASDRWDIFTSLFGRRLLVVDELSAPLLPLIALLFFLTALATLRIKLRRFSFDAMLVSEAIALATFSCKSPWLIIALLALGTVPPYLELRAHRRPTRVYLLHMGLFIATLVTGWAFVEAEGGQPTHTLWAVAPLLVAILIRSGNFPFHCWTTDLFEHASFGTALLFVTPLAGAYAAVRLVLPVAPDWMLRSIGLLSLAMAVYAACMALVQREARRFFCYIFLSHSALVLVGLKVINPIGLTGALCTWLAVSLSLGGLGLTLRAIEARRGRLSLQEYQGLYDHAPTLAVFFLLTGLASVGFPGTISFVGTELLMDGAVEAYPYVGVAVVITKALQGIALVQAYLVLFTGTRYASSIPLGTRLPERIAVLTLAALILVVGLFPQSSIASRYHAAHEILLDREAKSGQLTTTRPKAAAPRVLRTASAEEPEQDGVKQD